MSDTKHVTQNLVLTGHYAGKTCELNGHRFTDGKLTLKGSPSDVAGVANYMAASYQAFPQGSTELLKAQKRDKPAGKAKASAASKKGDSNGGSPDNGPVQGSGEPAAGGSGQDGTEPDSPAANDGSGADTTTPGGEGSVSEGDGHPNAGVPDQALIDAVSSLSVENDEHWTNAGQPLVAVVATVLERPDLSRKDIEAAMPGWNRDKALEIATM